jgi:hypothetical protein
LGLLDLGQYSVPFRNVFRHVVDRVWKCRRPSCQRMNGSYIFVIRRGKVDQVGYEDRSQVIRYIYISGNVSEKRFEVGGRRGIGEEKLFNGATRQKRLREWRPTQRVAAMATRLSRIAKEAQLPN